MQVQLPMDEMMTGEFAIGDAHPVAAATFDLSGPHPRVEVSVDVLRIELDGVLYRLTLTPPEVDAGRCEAHLDPNGLLDLLGADVPVEARQPQSWCDLRAGHTGCHRDQSTGAEWHRVDNLAAEQAEVVRCGLSLDELAATFKAHAFDRMTCLDHAHLGVACDPAGCHGIMDDQYRHYAEIVQAHSARISPAIQDVAAERASHAGRGWTAEHDAKIGVHTLIELSDRYQTEAVRWTRRNPLWVGSGFLRDRLVKAASLLVAAIELIDAESEQR
ncbi:hypothetical protein ATK74_0838 [Propionicimonas paludicola]|uniref:Uncharacterized protein n=1 Tax=Propionicimonas paludicola TaxID=185243 RepID=A0A2A9CPF1_9ACTN|nr:hypothetical protein [Propionicimonas paludicola]PFG16304.1 hypothetical protein ATK74_0838 [Propionicimonas paludicola]